MFQSSVSQELKATGITTEDVIRRGVVARITDRYKHLLSGSTNRRIFSAALLVGAITLIAKGTGTAKEILIAAWFGTGDALDAFLVAFLLPSYAINVVAGSMNAALIPGLVEIREREGAGAAQRLFSGTLLCSMGMLTLTIVILASVAPVLFPVLCQGFGPEKTQLTMRLFYLLIPGVLIAGTAMTCEAALNAGERFAFAAIAPAAVPLVTIAVLLAGGANFGIEVLALGLIVGFSIELIIVAFTLRVRGLVADPRWYGFEPGVRQVMRQYLPVVAGSALMCSNVLVDQAMASLLPPGSVSALNYGNKIVALVLTIGTMAFGTAALPYLSKMAAAADWPGLKHTLRTYLKLILLVTIPVVAIGAFLSQPLTALLYQRGEFTQEDTKLVGWIQVMYLLQVPFYSLTILFVRVISSLHANQLLMWGTVISVVLNFVLDWVLMQYMGVAGIALATSIVYAVLSGFLGLVLWLKLRSVTNMEQCG